MPEVSARGVLKAAWVKDFKEVVGVDLKRATEVIVDSFKKCMREVQAETPEKCLEKAAEEAGLGKLVRGVYGRKRAELKSTTGFDWHALLHELGVSLKATVKGRVAAAYKACMGKTDISAEKCYEAAAAEAQLGKAIKEAWDTITIKI